MPEESIRWLRRWAECDDFTSLREVAVGNDSEAEQVGGDEVTRSSTRTAFCRNGNVVALSPSSRRSVQLLALHAQGARTQLQAGTCTVHAPHSPTALMSHRSTALQATPVRCHSGSRWRGQFQVNSNLPTSSTSCKEARFHEDQRTSEHRHQWPARTHSAIGRREW